MTPPTRPIREVVFTGSHFERSLQRGRALRETLTPPAGAPPDPAFVQACMEETAEAFPPAKRRVIRTALATAAARFGAQLWSAAA